MTVRAEQELTLSRVDDGEDATVLHIDSTRGVVFKNNEVSTVLNVTIRKGAKAITDINSLRSEYGSGAYLQWWYQRLDDERFGKISAGDSRLSRDGFSLTLGPDDVDTKVVFLCELNV
ncbi:MAG: hypothetical protein HUJ76_02930 [Parasporobacterium sp.]|nr:hypothetical protein [Parasporobacterium sp.]